MRINFHGRLVDEPEIRAGFIGCGSHSFRNVYPTFQFAPVNLVATCDLEIDRAKAFAKKYGAEAAYDNYHEMLQRDDIDSIFVVTGYDKEMGRPLYPEMAIDAMKAGKHVWIEKPPSATCADIERMQKVSAETGKHVVVGMKKMFFPANEKVKELIQRPEWGKTSLVILRYPQWIPTLEDFRVYLQEKKASMGTMSFLDHLCHPMSLMVFLLGMPKTLYYERATNGAGLATFTFEDGVIATLALTNGQGLDEGLEHTLVVSDSGKHIVVENNIRVKHHQSAPGMGYGNQPYYYNGEPGQATSSWEPEFSLGQLYNKGLFLLGYYNEVNEFARCVLENRPPAKGTLEQAWQVTRVFEAFAEGPGKIIQL